MNKLSNISAFAFDLPTLSMCNPLYYYNGTDYNFTWSGRRMLSATTSGKTYSFTYDDAGLRTSKTVGQTVTNYYYNGDMLIAEVTDDVIIMYLYDENNLPMGMMYRNGSYSSEYWDMYWYTKNLLSYPIYLLSA